MPPRSTPLAPRPPFRETECVVEFAEGEQASIRGHARAVDFELQAAVKFEPEAGRPAFTRRILHPNTPPPSRNHCGSYMNRSSKSAPKLCYLGNPGPKPHESSRPMKPARATRLLWLQRSKSDAPARVSARPESLVGQNATCKNCISKLDQTATSLVDLATLWEDGTDRLKRGNDTDTQSTRRRLWQLPPDL